MTDAKALVLAKSLTVQNMGRTSVNVNTAFKGSLRKYQKKYGVLCVNRRCEQKGRHLLYLTPLHGVEVTVACSDTVL